MIGGDIVGFALHWACIWGGGRVVAVVSQLDRDGDGMHSSRHGQDICLERDLCCMCDFP
jgi:hypothetical protein